MRPDVGLLPTSHERMSGQPWDASYYDGPAPWDVGQPQPAVARLALEGRFSGAVLDAGCGTGENTLLVAALGLPVLGVDVAETALSMAREKAASAGSRPSSPGPTRCGWTGSSAGSTRFSTAGCSTRSTATSGRSTSRAWRR